ncbi:MAG: PilN domain-containing protein [Acidobacteria bacterium]|nr:PilN domain-containing protein [Acidobacteriota bacterium]
MLTTNLATRPFYNERAIHVGLAVVGFAAIVVLAFGAVRLVELSRATDLLTREAEVAERDASAITGRSTALERGLGEELVASLASAAGEVDRLIAQRSFSWTGFFNLIDETLPPGVMLTAVRPDTADGGLALELGVVGRNLAEIDQFIERLEATGAFMDVLVRQAELAEAGSYRAQVRGRVAPEAAARAAGSDAEGRS